MYRDGRPRWWTELPLIAVVYGLYSLTRLLVTGSEPDAVRHGLAILRFEQQLGIDAETPLNRLFTEHAWLGIPADFSYAALHYLVTPAVLIWLFRRRPGHYRAMRTWLMCTTLVGLVGFTLLPTCPPRLLEPVHGFVDTMAQYGEYGWWGGEASAPQGLGGMTNQFAAMPSLHVGWALWCGVVLWRLGRRTPWARTLAAAYPALTTLVVMGTANHYLLDAVAGATVLGLGLLLTRPALRLADRVRDAAGFADRQPTTEPTGPAEPVATPGVSEPAGPESGAGAPSVSAGCQTSAGTGPSREAHADDPLPRPRQHRHDDTADDAADAHAEQPVGSADESAAGPADGGVPAAAR